VYYRELHRHRDEDASWQTAKIDPLSIARRLWQHARPSGTALALDSDTGFMSAIAPNGSEQHHGPGSCWKFRI
jgi:hypothetical protein